MADYHDPERLANEIRQCLAQHKRPLGLLLGAGCPSSVQVSGEPLISDIAGLTKAVCQKICASDTKDLFKAFCTSFGVKGEPQGTIEEILTYIRSLQQVAGTGDLRGLTASHLALLDSAVCEMIYDLVFKILPVATTPYHKAALWMGAGQRESPVEVFTPNYDLLMEQALEVKRVPYFDGFVGAYEPFFDARAIEEVALPPRWVGLWKLHGSVNWYQKESGPKIGFVFRAEHPGHGPRRVIHPSHLKYDESRRMPYVALMDRLRAFLKKPYSVLVTCGYSFKDQHINAILIEGVQANRTSAIFGLLHGTLDKYPHVESLADNGVTLNLLARDGAVVAGKKAVWMTKAGTAVAKPSPAVKWTALKDGAMQAEFLLGDFVCFGDFLEELVGTTSCEGESDA